MDAMALHITDDAAADALLTDNPLALLIGMLLDRTLARGPGLRSGEPPRNYLLSERQRMPAAMNPSRSPSNTASGREDSCPVRRSFTSC